MYVADEEAKLLRASTEERGGPTDVGDVLNWPRRLVEAVRQDAIEVLERYSRLRKRWRFELHTMFSGFGGLEVGIDLLDQASASVGDGDGFAEPGSGLNVVSACEIAKLPHRILTGYSKRPGRTHEFIFRDILDSLRPEALEALLRLQPTNGMDAQGSRCCFERMVSVFKHRETHNALFKACMVGECPWWRRPANSCATVDVVWDGIPLQGS